MNRRQLIGSLLGTVVAVPFWGRFDPLNLVLVPPRLDGFRISFHARADRGLPIEELWAPDVSQAWLTESAQRCEKIDFVSDKLHCDSLLFVEGMSLWTPDGVRVRTIGCGPIRMGPGHDLEITYSVTNQGGVDAIFDPQDWQCWSKKLRDKFANDSQRHLDLFKNGIV